MGLNNQKGNMYGFVTHTWNTVKGECPHGCHYCYMKRFGNLKPVRFDKSELNTDLGNGNFIFVGSSCDMWADSISYDWIKTTLIHCKTHWGNTYLFQSKNPERFLSFQHLLLSGSWVGTTIESNRWLDEMGDAPHPRKRASIIYDLATVNAFQTFVTIEPIMDFDLDAMEMLIRQMLPRQVNIGANTNHRVKLPEPSAEKVIELIESIQPITTVRIKTNLKRIIGDAVNRMLED